MAVLITGVIVSVAKGVGGTIFWGLPQEIWIRKNTNVIRKLNDRFKSKSSGDHGYLKFIMAQTIKYPSIEGIARQVQNPNIRKLAEQRTDELLYGSDPEIIPQEEIANAYCPPPLESSKRPDLECGKCLPFPCGF
jgi:hypothetical protein